MYLITHYLLVTLLLGLTGCENVPEHDPAFAPVQASSLRPPPVNTGAIYQAGYDMRLFEDRSARRIGDIVTVKLVENTDAQKKSDLKASKDTSIEASIPTLLGLSPGKIFGQDVSTTASVADAFKGASGTAQSNSLFGDITVTVTDVLPNGNLKIRGEKRVTLNRGSEYIRLSGMIRPMDIDSSNSVLSTKVADATIMYTGDGTPADASKAGWFSRLFFSPLFPF